MEEGSIVVIVGPNNVGKSRGLNEIERFLSSTQVRQPNDWL